MTLKEMIIKLEHRLHSLDADSDEAGELFQIIEWLTELDEIREIVTGEYDDLDIK